MSTAPDSHAKLVLPSDRNSSGRDLGAAELANLEQVIRSGHLIATNGPFCRRFETEFAARHGRRFAVALSSGSTAVHAAIAALQLNEGDEVVTTPITDMGAVMPICHEGARPVFADVDPTSGNVTANTLAGAMSDRTRAVIVTHLFGQSCDMPPIVELCRARGIALIEDAAQAFLATAGGVLCGTFGDVACFSFQQGKHLTTGEGGMVMTDDPSLADAMRRFVNKGFGYGDALPDHDRPGINARMTELQAAVGVAQLAKLDAVVTRRRRTAARLLHALRDLSGIGLPTPSPGTEHSYWRFALRIDPRRIPGGATALGVRLSNRGIGNAPHYIRQPAFECAVFVDRAKFLVMRNAFGSNLHGPLGDRTSHPGTYAALDAMLVLPWNEHYTDEHVDAIARAIRECVREIQTDRENEVGADG
ncbi:MAG: DegT/DnrJ/EryC1/StrS family aminotransferase [Planctomycetota bacterium]